MADSNSTSHEEIESVIRQVAALEKVPEDEITVEQIQDAVEELEASDRVVESTIQKTKRGEDKDTARKEQEIRKLKRRLTLVGLVLAIALFALGMLFIRSYQSLNGRYRNASKKRVQVHNLLENRKELRDQSPNPAETSDTNTQVEDGDRRLRVRLKRYDMAAAGYNKAAKGTTGWILTTVTSLPHKLPLSDELENLPRTTH